MADALKVFILGPPRSGTSILYFALGETFRLDGTGESHVMPIFAELEARWSAYTARFRDANVLASRLDPAAFRRVMIEHLRQFYTAQFPAGHWVDKSPGVIAGVPLILAAFPDARVLLTRRTGIEVVMSHMAKFGAPLREACRMWRHSMEGLVAVRAQPPAITAQVLEQDQFELASAPDASGRRIATHLGRPEAGWDLALYFVEHDVEKTSRHDWTRRLTLADTGWRDDDKRVFVAECGPMMETLGYPM